MKRTPWWKGFQETEWDRTRSRSFHEPGNISFLRSSMMGGYWVINLQYLSLYDWVVSTPHSSTRHEKRQKHVQSRFNLSGDAWADIVNKQPLNSAFLFKVTHKTFPKTIFIKSDNFRFLCFYETRTTLWRTSSSIVWNSLGSSGLGSAQWTLHNFRESALEQWTSLSPALLRDDLGYILGYRWGVDQSALAEKYKMVVFLHTKIVLITLLLANLDVP